MKKYLPEGSSIGRVEPDFTDILSVETDPPGATVSLQRYQKDPDTGAIPHAREDGRHADSNPCKSPEAIM